MAFLCAPGQLPLIQGTQRTGRLDQQASYLPRDDPRLSARGFRLNRDHARSFLSRRAEPKEDGSSRCEAVTPNRPRLPSLRRKLRGKQMNMRGRDGSMPPPNRGRSGHCFFQGWGEEIAWLGRTFPAAPGLGTHACRLDCRCSQVRSGWPGKCGNSRFVAIHCWEKIPCWTIPDRPFQISINRCQVSPAT
jgi:hypothetical protein